MNIRLKKVTLSGFKSFRDRSVVEFTDGMTAIVGPNGCGKSNVLDAIRWVLGENSAKALRGGKMPDVLFGGTEKSKGKGIADVRALFETPHDCLGIGSSELEIGRRLSSDGVSEYFVNDKTVRLKDLHLLLHKMGLGKEGFWCFEQGRVDQVVSWTPEERRVVFEETSGISLYLSQKKEALDKLKETKDALEKLLEREREATKLLELLKAQAEATERYLKVKERSHIVEKEVYKTRLYHLDDAIEKEKKKLLQIQEEKKNLEAVEKAIKATLSPSKEAEKGIGAEKKSFEEALLQLKHQSEGDRRELDGLISRTRGLQGVLNDRQERIEKEEKTQQKLQEEIGRLKKEITDIRVIPLREKLQNLLRNREEKELKLEKTLLEEKVEEEKRLEAVNKKHFLEKRLLEIGQEKRIHLEFEMLQKKKETLQKEIESRTLKVETVQKKDLQAEISEKEERIATLKKKLQDLSEENASLQGQLRSLEELHKKLPKPLEGNLKILAWASEPNSPLKGKIVPLLKKFPLSSELIEKGSALLGPTFDALYLEDLSLLDGILEKLNGLSFSLYHGNDLEHSLREVKVEKGALHHPLGWIISDKPFAPHPLVLDEEGQICKEKMRALQLEKETLLSELSDLEKKLYQDKGTLKNLEKEEVFRAEELKRTVWDLEKTKESLAQVEKRVVPLVPEEEEKTRALLNELVFEKTSSRGLTLKQELDRLRREEKELRDLLFFEEKKGEERGKTLLLKERDWQEREREKGRLFGEKQELQQKLSSLPKEIEPLKEKLTLSEMKKSALETSLDKASQRLKGLLLKISEDERQLEKTIERLQQVRLEEEREKNNLAGLFEKRASLQSEVFEQLGLTLDYFIGVTPRVSLKEIEKEWKELKKTLEEFTDVSLSSLERYRVEVEAAESLRKDIGDLEGAHGTALKWIEELDLISEKKFLEVFKEANIAFREAFERLFRGGEARLFLSKPEAPLVSGIELHVQPPGKALKSAGLLSGGEKCLVGIALLIALFSVKKAPISLFDEVDAPLDEANLGRFLDLLVPFSEKTQVILISHKRHTMEKASSLLGVTMAEKGVSKVFPLSLKHQLQEASI